MARTAYIVGAVVVIAIVGVAAGFLLMQPGDSGGGVSFELALTEFQFQMDTQSNPPLTVQEGDSVTITLTNQGGLEHNFVIVEESVLQQVLNDEITPAEAEDMALFDSFVNVDVGGSESITFTANEAGEYAYACFETSGVDHAHAKEDMHGDFVVEG